MAVDLEWTGEYRIGAGALALTGQNLLLQPNGAFKYENWGCTGSYDYFGMARWVAGGIEFTGEHPELEDRYHCIRWGKGRYLLSDSDLDGIVHSLNSGWIENWGPEMYWGHSENPEPLTHAVPELPEEYLARVRSQPLEPRLVELRVEKMAFRRVGVVLTFDMGSVDGLTSLMMLRNRKTGMRARVWLIEKTRCAAYLESVSAEQLEQLVETLESGIGERWTERAWE